MPDDQDIQKPPDSPNDSLTSTLVDDSKSYASSRTLHAAPSTSAGDEQHAQERSASADAPTAEGSSQPQTSPKLASHNPLVFSNYPPLWDPNKQSSPSTSRSRQKRTGSGMPAETIAAVLSTKSSDDGRTKSGRFNEKDPSNRHEYLQHPDQPYSRPRLNVFGRDIGGLGRPPSLSLRSGRKKK